MALGADGVDQGAVVGGGEVSGHRLFEIEPLAEDYGRHRMARIIPLFYGRARSEVAVAWDR
jgi:hypothetical protein